MCVESGFKNPQENNSKPNLIVHLKRAKLNGIHPGDATMTQHMKINVISHITRMQILNKSHYHLKAEKLHDETRFGILPSQDQPTR